MRLSTQTLYSMGTRSILDQQAKVSNLGEQLATGRRINRPSDDPSAAAEVMQLEQARQINDQYATTRETAARSLSGQESRLDDVTRVLDNAKQSLVRASNGTLGPADRQAIANDLESAYQQLVGAANARDSAGNYMFGGHKSDTPPFTGEAGQMNYVGDEGTRKLRVDGSREMNVGTAGSAIFTSVAPQAQPIATADAGNQGTAVYERLNVVDAGKLAENSEFSLSFAADDEGAMRYTVQNAAGEVVGEGAYKAGETIALGDAMETRIKGQPAEGDSFVFARGRDADNNILNAIADTVSALREPPGDDSQRARLGNALNRANRQTDNALDNVLSVRSSVGTRLAEIDDLDTAGNDRALALKNDISDLRDIDMASTISDFLLSQTALQAARQTFSSVSKMSLFDMV